MRRVYRWQREGKPICEGRSTQKRSSFTDAPFCHTQQGEKHENEKNVAKSCPKSPGFVHYSKFLLLIHQLLGKESLMTHHQIQSTPRPLKSPC